MTAADFLKKDKTMRTPSNILKTISFGTELEYEGITREAAAHAVHSVVGGHIRYVAGSYDTWQVVAPDGRIWKCMRDGSLCEPAAETVTPILHYEDIPMLQEVVRALRRAGAKATGHTSQHVHIGAEAFTAGQLINLAKIFFKQEELLIRAVGTYAHRLGHYTERTSADFVRRLSTLSPTKATMEDFNRAWFGSLNLSPLHYDGHRYHTINFNNIWRTGTVEFRLFNGTTHAGEVKANIIMCLAMAARAKTVKSASLKKPRTDGDFNPAFDMRGFLGNLGLIGEEFATVRHHMYKRLPGNPSRKHALPA